MHELHAFLENVTDFDTIEDGLSYKIYTARQNSPVRQILVTQVIFGDDSRDRIEKFMINISRCVFSGGEKREFIIADNSVYIIQEVDDIVCLGSSSLNRTYTKEEIIYILSQVMSYLHDSYFLYSCIRLRHIWIDKQCKVKIAWHNFLIEKELGILGINFDKSLFVEHGIGKKIVCDMNYEEDFKVKDLALANDKLVSPYSISESKNKSKHLDYKDATLSKPIRKLIRYIISLTAFHNSKYTFDENECFLAQLQNMLETGTLNGIILFISDHKHKNETSKIKLSIKTPTMNSQMHNKASDGVLAKNSIDLDDASVTITRRGRFIIEEYKRCQRKRSEDRDVIIGPDGTREYKRGRFYIKEMSPSDDKKFDSQVMKLARIVEAQNVQIDLLYSILKDYGIENKLCDVNYENVARDVQKMFTEFENDA